VNIAVILKKSLNISARKTANRFSKSEYDTSTASRILSSLLHLGTLLFLPPKMPPVRSARNRKPPPDGFDDIEDTLLEFSNKMKDAENASHEGKKRHEVLWPIFQISHQRMFQLMALNQSLLIILLRIGSRYIYDLYYDKEAISKQLYEWLLKNGYADGNLIAKWKKQGYEKVCFLGSSLFDRSPLTALM
jgi:bud site selection protein 31